MTVMCVDLEASGLGSDGWPIEVGVAWLDGDAVRSNSRLIRPRPEWPEEGWIWESAQVHGISREALDQHGHDPDEVALWFQRVAWGYDLLSDAPEYDGRWLGWLFDLDAAGIDLVDYDRAVWTEFRSVPDALRGVYEFKSRRRTEHRAEADARDLMTAWREGVRRLRNSAV